MELSAAAFRFHRCAAPHLALSRSVATANPPSLWNRRVPPIAPLAVRLDRRDPLLLTGGRSRLFSSWLRESKKPAFSAVRAIRGEMEPAGSLSGKIAVASTVTILLAVLNRVLYKLALVPMKEYPFFLAQVTTFGYVAVYFFILYLRYSAGIVTKEMLALPKSQFIAIGFLEALGVASGMSAGAMLPGPAIPILSQTFLVWQLILSVLILGRKYSFIQVFGCLLVTAGVVISVASGANNGEFLSQVELLWPALMVASSAFQAAASILKEFVFIDGAKRLWGKPPDIFVVNSFGSGFQALFVFLLLPFLSNIRGIPFAELPAYLRSGAACFLNVGSLTKGCEGAPLLPLLFIAMNMAFNISLLNLVKMSSALVSSLAITLAVPLSIYILSLPLPYIPEGASLNVHFVVGAAILVLGLIIYNLPRSANQNYKSD
ncbi:protein CLT2, chloroplastic [Musa acuminata AAA Group]|uniref:Protein CLT2, chloroplastic n=1 Tax=Musa acuminata subsp. malaccensis TaxID=214687 RepID=A0A804KCY9_MUSAM|nr:PREDICTED: protein CLT2, chloroplastic [Musa acuminata subsp. malaccensis]